MAPSSRVPRSRARVSFETLSYLLALSAALGLLSGKILREFLL